MTTPGYTDWFAGMRVVCVKRAQRWYDFETIPEVDEVYTLRSLEVAPDGHLYVRLTEIKNEPVYYLDGFAECCFWAGDFRPVQTRKTDISIFTAMLNPANSKVGA